MTESETFLRILLTVVFGVILGLETETRNNEKKNKEKPLDRIGGVRTYTILSLAGGITGLLYNTGAEILVYITFLSIIGLVLAAYILNVQYKHAFGLTTEVAIFLTFLIGFVTTSNILSISIALFLLVILAFFLSQKRGLGGLISKIGHDEVIDIIKFGLISLVVLPILPNQTYTIEDFFTSENLQMLKEQINPDVLNIAVINPFRIWLIVVVISGINLGGYISSRFIGKSKSLTITAAIGGLVSSTSSIVAFASSSKNTKYKNLNKKLAGSALIAHGVSFLSSLVLVSILNLDLLNQLLPAILLFFSISILIGAFLIISSRGGEKIKEIGIKESNFELSPAIKFVALIVSITLLIQFFQLIDVDLILIIVTALSGISGLDASTIATSELLNNSSISLSLATFIFLATNFVNIFAKIAIGMILGSKEFSRYLGIGLLLSLFGSFAAFF